MSLSTFSLVNQPWLPMPGETVLHPRMCMGFSAGDPEGHHLVYRTAEEAVYLEVGDRLPGDAASYPEDDLKSVKRG